MCLLKSEIRLAPSLPNVCSGDRALLPAGCHSSVTPRRRMLGMSSNDRKPGMCMFCQNCLAPGKNRTVLVCFWYNFLTIHSVCQSCLWSSLKVCSGFYMEGATQVVFLQLSSLQLSRTLEGGRASVQSSPPHGGRLCSM